MSWGVERCWARVDFELLLVLAQGWLVGVEPSQRPAGLHDESQVQSASHGLTADDWAGICEAHEAGRHAVQAVTDGFRVRNPGQQWVTCFDRRGFTTTPDAGGWTWGLELRSYGFRGGERAIDGCARVQVEGSRLTYAWDETLEEWYVNDGRGLEHGYTLRERPAQAAGAEEPLTFELAVRGGLHAEVLEGERGARFLDEGGAPALVYAGLVVLDDSGRSLPARIESAGGRLQLLVDDRGARYPLTVDPIAQQAYFKASNTGAADLFGREVAIAGDTLVVGAAQEDSDATGVDGDQGNDDAPNSGAVYVFVRSKTGWTQQAYLKASNAEGDDRFGSSVSISGDTLVVGATGEESNATGVNGDQDNDLAPDSGAAYVFVRTGTTWAQEAYLKASNTDEDDAFGQAVSVSGDTVVVSCAGEDSNATGVNGDQGDNSAQNAGAAYVFVRTGTTWTQQAYLKASNSEEFDQFGASASVSDGTVVVGALTEGSSATGVNGDQSNNDLDAAGAAYVFVRDDTTWTQQAYLKASNTESADVFGAEVSISGNTVVVGAFQEDSSATGVNGNQSNNLADSSGAAYVFVREGTTWSQQAYLKASNTESQDKFSQSISISGETVVVTSFGEDSNATGVNGNQSNNLADGSGAAYVFGRDGTVWSQRAYLKASNTGVSDAFGLSVAVSNYTVVVGAPSEDSGSTGVNGNQADDSAGAAGAVYAFVLTTTWTGASDSDWTESANWSGGVPDSTLAAIVPDATTTANDPVISVAGQTSNTLWIQTGGTLDVSAGSDSLGIHGGAIVAGPITGTGEMVFEAAGTLTGNATIDPEVRAEADLAVEGGPLTLTGTLTVDAELTLRPDSSLSIGTSLDVTGDLEVQGLLEVDGPIDVGGDLTGSDEAIITTSSGSCELSVGGDDFHFPGVLDSCTLVFDNPTNELIVIDAAGTIQSGLIIDTAGVVLIDVASLTIPGGIEVQSGTLDVAGNELIASGADPVVIEGTLAIGPCGRLLLETNVFSVETGGTLSMVGSPGCLAVVRGFDGGGYSFVLEDGASLEALNFEFQEMGPSGIVIEDSVTIASAPRDLRSGLFDRPATNGVLLDITRTSAARFRYLRFENSLGAMNAKNVRVGATSAAIELVFWSGAFGGEPFEDDPGVGEPGLLEWGLEFWGGPAVVTPKIAVPGPSSVPPPLVVGTGGGFRAVDVALESLASRGSRSSGEMLTLELDRGVHALFVIEGSALPLGRLRLVARPGARIDTASGPVRIAGLARGTRVELVGITFTSSHPALVIEDCTGTVVLEDARVEGELVLSNATSVYLRTCTIDALLLERASHARAWGGEFDEAELRGGSTLVTLGTACEPLVSPDSAWRALDRPLTLQLLRPLPILEFLGSHARR